jgi:hypothetical protein
MPTACQDHTGLHFLPDHHAWGGFVCARCVVRAQLQRDVAPTDADTMLAYDLEVQRQIDVWNGRAQSTTKGYLGSHRSIARFGKAIGVSLFPVTKPPVPKLNLSIVFAWYVLNAMLTGGRGKRGRTLGTLDSHAAAYSYYWRMYLAGDAPTKCDEYADFLKGVGRRAKRSSKQAHAFTIALITHIVETVWATLPADMAGMLPTDPRFNDTYTSLLFLCVLLVSFLACLRGNEPYKVETKQVMRDMVLGSKALAAKCTAHFLFDFNTTKTAQFMVSRVPVVACTRAGLHLARVLLPFLTLRRRLRVDSDRLFVRHCGRPMSSTYFLNSFLRPSFVIARGNPNFADRLSTVEVSDVTTNSLRRGGNSAAAAARVPKFLRNGHCRWKQPNPDMADLYTQAGLEDRLSVTYDMIDEVVLALRHRPTSTATRPPPPTPAPARKLL